MFGSQYYCLVAGLREYNLDTETKGLDVKAIIAECLEEVSSQDGAIVRLLYNYYDCENIAVCKAGRSAHNNLGTLTRAEVEELVASTSFDAYENLLPERLIKVFEAFASTKGEQSQESGARSSFEKVLFGAYYEECAAAKSKFMRKWSETDRNLRNVTAAVLARSLEMPIEEAVVGEGDIVDQLIRSTAADFGLRGELAYIDGVISAVNDEPNMVEKEHKIDLIRWAEATELSEFDYFSLDAVLAYLVKVNIVARWVALDPKRGAEMFQKLVGELGAKDLINNK
ncbi:MAG: DUF2764 family protein [Rikenellaceae bacterium]